MEIDKFIREAELGLPRLGQIGIITAGIRDALPGIAAAFNLKKWYEPQYKEKRFFINNKQVDLDFHLVFGYSGSVQIELIEERSGNAALYADQLERDGQGIHHLGFFIPDLDAKLDLAEQMNLEVIFESRFTTAGGGAVRFAYLDTRPQCGIILELINIKLYGINVPQTEFMMNIARLTGEVRKFQI